MLTQETRGDRDQAITGWKAAEGEESARKTLSSTKYHIVSLPNIQAVTQT